MLVARAHFVIETSIVDMSPRSGPAGTPVTIHLKGVGWTEYDNIYVATYDNAYMGYACGFNSRPSNTRSAITCVRQLVMNTSKNPELWSLW